MEGDEASFYQAARRLARRTGRQGAGISALFDDGRGQAEVHVLAWRLGALKAPFILGRVLSPVPLVS